jgi:hypothetical protein
MARRTRLGALAAIAGLSGGIALLIALLAGCQPLQTPEQKSASQPTPGGGTSGNPIRAGSFPRSFLIPGTDTSIRIGG